MWTYTLPALVALTAVPAAHAQMLGWSGDVELGYNAASGNSSSSNLKAGVKARRDWREWALEGHAKANFAKSDHVRSEENYAAGLQGERKLSDIDFIFGAADYTVDNFSGYDYQTTQTVGYGRTLLKDAKQTLKGQLGVGMRESKTQGGKTSADAVLEPKLDYAYHLNDNVTFTEVAKGTLGTEYGVLQSETGITSKLTDSLYLKASYTVKHTTEVPVGTKKNDTLTGISLGYTF